MMHLFEGKYQQVDLGLSLTTPVSVANTLQNSVAGPLSVVLVVIFAGTLIYGLFYPYFMSKESFLSRSHQSESSPSFVSSLFNQLDIEEAFQYLNDNGEDDDRTCRRKILCHLHSFLPRAPRWFQTAFRFISRGVRGMNEYKEDVIYGLSGADCVTDDRYKSCPHSIAELLIQTRPIRHILEAINRSTISPFAF